MVIRTRFEKRRSSGHHNGKHNVMISVPNKRLRLYDTQDTATDDTRNKLAMMIFNQMTALCDWIEGKYFLV